MSGEYGALAAKARAIYGRRLTAADFSALIRKSSVAEVMSYLKGTPRFSSEFASVNELTARRAQIESLLERSLFEIYGRLLRSAGGGDDGFPKFMFFKYELDVIVNVSLYILIDKQESVIAYLPFYMEDLLGFELAPLGKIKTASELPAAFADTDYADILVEHFGGNKTPKVDLFLRDMNARYVDKMTELAAEDISGDAKNEVIGLIKAQAEIDNLLLIYRLRSLFKEPSTEILPLLLPIRAKLPKGVAQSAANEHDADAKVLALLKKYYFKDKIVCDLNNIEVSARKYMRDRCARLLHMSEDGAAVMYALMRLLDIEKHNVITVVESVKYALPVTETEKMLVN
ncbi:MAG: V-type ATPase subunit [Oscillospiraceae bacterium]|jgi:V/A-type H+-transporting ATPase subunit C|nr:V-type ATPase subunit [Oscillospiraceae bacterium]